MYSYKGFYSEDLRDGSLHPLSYNGSKKFPSKYLTFPEAFSITADGIDLRGLFSASGFEENETDNGDYHAVLTLSCANAGLSVKIHTETSGRCGCNPSSLRRYLEITNLTERPISLTDVQIMSGCLFNGSYGNQYSIGYMREGAPGREGDFQWVDMPEGEFSLCNRSYPERYRFPFAVVCDKTNGDTAVLDLGFSGGFVMSFGNFASQTYNCANLSFTIGFSGPAPVRVLEPGEIALTPELHLCRIHGGLDEALHELNDECRGYAEQWEKHLVVECACMTMLEEEVRKTISIAEKLRAELMYIDAGWYIPKTGNINKWPFYTGDWEREPDTYESSIDDFRDYCHSKGMKFGLWMDVEKIGFLSDTYREGKIAYLTEYSGHPVPDGPGSYLTDVTDPDTAEWVYRNICYVIDRFKLDYFRLDSGAYSAGSQRMRCGMRENVDWRYNDIFYAMFSRLRREYPDVIFQNCAGGGMRADMGMASIMSNTWISDCNVAPNSFSIINGMSMVIPVEYCVKLINGMGAEYIGSDYFKLNVARFGSPLIPIIMDDEQFCQRTDAMLDMYRNYIRPMLRGCNVYHHTPAVNLGASGSVGILEAASKNGDCAMLAVFTLGPVTSPDIRTSFSNLIPDRKYRVWTNDANPVSRTGQELLNSFTVTVNEMYDSVCLIAVDESKVK